MWTPHNTHFILSHPLLIHHKYRHTHSVSSVAQLQKWLCLALDSQKALNEEEFSKYFSHPIDTTCYSNYSQRSTVTPSIKPPSQMLFQHTNCKPVPTSTIFFFVIISVNLMLNIFTDQQQDDEIIFSVKMLPYEPEHDVILPVTYTSDNITFTPQRYSTVFIIACILGISAIQLIW